MAHPVHTHLSDEDVERLGDELDALRNRVLEDLGEADAAYIRRVVAVQRGCEFAGRALLSAGILPPAFVAGVAALSMSKILDNMEIGHNVMHGQYDWMNDLALHSSQFEWDTAAPADNWKHSHNFVHHTYTNILGKDRDIGYGLLRMSDEQPWHPVYLGNPIYAGALALFFQWGVALHDLEVERLRTGETQWDDVSEAARLIRHKSAQQAGKDYVLFPLLAGPLAPVVLAGNVSANLVRNVWAFAIIFCGHFPEEVAVFHEEEVEDETHGGWYLRQMLGSANITGGSLFHVLTGNLSHQIEHHLYPDLPARRYQEIAHEVREICERYGLPYNTGPLRRQLGSVAKKIVRLALPGKAEEAPQVVPPRQQRDALEPAA